MEGGHKMNTLFGARVTKDPNSLEHHGIKGQKWGVRRYQNPDGTYTDEGKRRRNSGRSTDISDVNYAKLEKLYRSMPLEDRKLIDPDISSESDRYFSDKNAYKKSTAFNSITDDGFIIAEKIPHNQNVDGTKGVEVAIGVTNKGQGTGTKLTRELVDWFDNQDDYDTMWWPVDKSNKASIRVAEKNGFFKDPLGDNYVYAKNSSLEKLGISKSVSQESADIRAKLSNTPKPFVETKPDINQVMNRGSLSKSEAKECMRLADDIFDNAQRKEPKITRDVIDAVDKSGSNMYGLEYRLKQRNSLAAKIGSDAKGDGVSFGNAARGINDSIRYTSVSEPSKFVDNYKSVKKQLSDDGYSEVKCKNYFTKFRDGQVEHKAVQSIFKSPDGTKFELQFQTPESQAAKELKIPLYEEARKSSTTPERMSELTSQMHNLATQVQDPDGVFDILSHVDVAISTLFGSRVLTLR